jgi:uncharacterized membrane protein
MTHRLFLPVAATFSVLIALMSWRFLAQGLGPAFPQMLGHIEATRLAFLVHVAAAPVALALATFQLMPRLRARRPRVHRWSGRVYGLAILVGGVGALVMAPGSNGGLVASIGFGLLGVLWIAFTGIGIARARAGDYAAHRRWMIRSFALTFAAVTLRLWLFPMMASGMAYEEAIAYLAWLAWVPNLVVAEAMLRRRVAPPVPA